MRACRSASNAPHVVIGHFNSGGTLQNQYCVGACSGPCLKILYYCMVYESFWLSQEGIPAQV
ncbi:hypothetical protein BU24DRAFT_421207 [Aaosphaeria arxii CBS 175.79]|uniref:Uncharacterized protein n=1 Tax=Aaosphaeria arxii CBS 175.79 TaxID=1450172 RepID=A0A6A5XZF9_9PLEO|nr:uncharacterized protein BU24DRAFT_421207 [Aaosphaeria arxii CBS 175.79]KAF2018197.1 hypothetical protein BU24DRAFT_421207 [Aaosphaeria arxii CBS 175.79]